MSSEILGLLLIYPLTYVKEPITTKIVQALLTVRALLQSKTIGSKEWI